MKIGSASLILVASAALRSAAAFAPKSHLGQFAAPMLFSSKAGQLPVMAEEEVMSQKAHGTSEKPVQKNLRWNCDFNTADRICNFNRKCFRSRSFALVQ